MAVYCFEELMRGTAAAQLVQPILKNLPGEMPGSKLRKRKVLVTSDALLAFKLSLPRWEQVKTAVGVELEQDLLSAPAYRTWQRLVLRNIQEFMKRGEGLVLKMSRNSTTLGSVPTYPVNSTSIQTP